MPRSFGSSLCLHRAIPRVPATTCGPCLRRMCAQLPATAPSRVLSPLPGFGRRLGELPALPPQPRPTTVDATGPPHLLLALPGCLPILPADAGGLPLPHHAHAAALRHPASRCLAPPPPHARCSGLRRRRAPNRYAHPSLPFVLCETEHPNPGYICIQI